MHTSGPWKWDFTENGEIVIYQDRGIQRHIARVLDGVTDLEQAENADLLVAAPDLLYEATKQVHWLRHLRAEAAGTLRGSLIDGIDQSIKYLSAAIAKATGTP